MHIVINKKLLNYGNYSAKCALGKRGIGNKKKEGDFITPTGIFKIKCLLYRKDRIKSIKTKIIKKIIKRNMGWCDDPKSPHYNKLIQRPSNYSHEILHKRNNIYDLILVLDYNMNPVKKNKGSAIFVHVAKRSFRKTEGCIAVKKKDLLKIISEIKRSTKVKIVNQK